MSERLVLTPMGVERLALRGAVHRARLRRSGYGPDRSWATARRLAAGPRPVIVAGVGGAVAPGISPGDVVVATEVRGDDVTVPVPTAALLAAALRRQGLTVHTGPVLSVPRVLAGKARRALADTGILAVDLESGSLVAAADGGPFAVVRVIVDTPEYPLLRPGTARRGVHALRALRAAAPAIEEWLAACGPREMELASPRSFCAGVGRAIEIVERGLERYGAPVYVRRQIVHNAHVVDDLERRGAIFVEEVEEIPPGSVVVLAAHGVTPQVRADAERRDLMVIDATCPLVAKVHSEVRRYAAGGDTVFLIGHRDHEEVVGTVGEAEAHVQVVENVAAAREVQPVDPNRVAYVMQTTLAVDEASEIAETLRARFPTLNSPRRDDICYATTNRQAAVREIATDSELLLVVGSPNSSNSRRLVEVAERAGCTARLIDDVRDVDLRWLVDIDRIGITAGASAPPRLVDELVDALSGLGAVSVHEKHVIDENIEFTLPREVS